MLPFYRWGNWVSENISAFPKQLNAKLNANTAMSTLFTTLLNSLSICVRNVGPWGHLCQYGSADSKQNSEENENEKKEEEGEGEEKEKRKRGKGRTGKKGRGGSGGEKWQKENVFYIC